MHVLKTLRIETRELELKIIGEKYQYKDNSILINALGDVKWIQIPDTIKEIDLTILGQLDDVTWTNYNPLPLLEDNNSIMSLQRDGIGSNWFTSEETSCTNDSRTFLNTDEGNLYNEGNSCGFIAIPAITGSSQRRALFLHGI